MQFADAAVIAGVALTASDPSLQTDVGENGENGVRRSRCDWVCRGRFRGGLEEHIGRGQVAPRRVAGAKVRHGFSTGLAPRPSEKFRVEEHDVEKR
jgi:hypothetical protein